MDADRVRAYLQVACAGLGFDIGEVWWMSNDSGTSTVAAIGVLCYARVRFHIYFVAHGCEFHNLTLVTYRIWIFSNRGQERQRERLIRGRDLFQPDSEQECRRR